MTEKRCCTADAEQQYFGTVGRDKVFELLNNKLMDLLHKLTNLLDTQDQA